ncbi:MAG: hypothetical protein LAO30_23060 [Acidobacteriia bacterium]|nr:hypothetical protein [Terriglobia bacterium]
MHNASILVHLAKKLSVRGTIQADQVFRSRRFFVLSNGCPEAVAGAGMVVPKENVAMAT